jgi:hypothetical protein
MVSYSYNWRTRSRKECRHSEALEEGWVPLLPGDTIHARAERVVDHALCTSEVP